MLQMSHEVVSRRPCDLTEDEALATGRLLAEVWPKPGRGAHKRAEQLLAIGGGYAGPPEAEPQSHTIRDGDAVIAHALTFLRTVRTGEGDRPVMALAMVAADPSRRGEGLGATIVRAAFERVDAGVFPCSLYQTSHEVRPFYERLGACLVENRIVNSLDEADPTGNPFWDDVVMRYPASADWAEGIIDLRGAGY